MNEKRILVVDDDVAVMEMLKLNLERVGGYKVYIENDPARALAAARNFRPHLVLLDVMMPGMDGGDVAAKLKTDSEIREVPVIFLTALVSQEEIPSGGIVNRGHTMLSKATPVEQLVQCIETELANQSIGRFSPAGFDD